VTALPAGQESSPREIRFPCSHCGALLSYAPGTRNLHCDYCGGDTPIDDQDIVSDPMQTSFFKAMQLSAGVVIVLNGVGGQTQAATAFNRTWCAFEVSVATDLRLQGLSIHK